MFTDSDEPNRKENNNHRPMQSCQDIMNDESDDCVCGYCSFLFCSDCFHFHVQWWRGECVDAYHGRGEVRLQDKFAHLQAQRDYHTRKKSKRKRSPSWSRAGEDSSEVVEEVMKIHSAKKDQF